MLKRREETHVKVVTARKNQIPQTLATRLLSTKKRRHRVDVDQHARLSPDQEAIALDRPQVRQDRVLRQVTGRRGPQPVRTHEGCAFDTAKGARFRQDHDTSTTCI